MDPKCIATGPNCNMRMRELAADCTAGRVEYTDGIGIYESTMEPQKFLTSEPAWQKLQDYFNETGKNLVIKDLFAQDTNRFNKFRYVFMFICMKKCF